MVAFELQLNGPLGEELHRLLLSEIDAALAGVRDARDKDAAEQAVHATRRHIKKTRALLRLIDGRLQRRPFAQCDDELRAAGRALSAARDAAVQRRTLAVLAESRPAKATATALQRLLDGLQGGGAPGPAAHALQTTQQALLGTRTVLAEYTFTDCDFATLAAGFATTYRNGRRALRRAEATPTSDRLHALRKSLKHHGYQLRLLRPLWPGPLGAWHAQADRAAEHLGQHHDCAVLRAQLSGSVLSVGNQARVDALAAQRQRHLAHTALATCRRLYAERSRCYARRIKAYGASVIAEGLGDPTEGSAE